MGIDHSRADVFMPKRLLDHSNVTVCLKRTGGEGMPKGMIADMIDNARLSDGFLDSVLLNRLVRMMPPLFSGLSVLRSVFLREDLPPTPFLGRVVVF